MRTAYFFVPLGFLRTPTDTYLGAPCGAAGIFIFGAKLNCAGFLADPKLILILVRAQLGGGLLTAGAG